jgi:hypothetical protein
VHGPNEIPTEGIANIQLRFVSQQFYGDIYLMAVATGGSRDEVTSTLPYRLKLARFKLHIHNFHKDTFFKDSFGKYSYIKTIVYLLGNENRLIQDVMIPLQVSLRYEDNLDEVVPSPADKPAFNLFDLRHRIEKGCSLIPFRIEVVSSSHNNRNFVFYVQPEANGRYDDGSILPCVSTPIEVKARLRPFNPDRTPPKYNPNRYQQEQDAIRQSARELLDSGTAQIQEALKSNNLTSPSSASQKKQSSPSQSPNGNADLDIPLGGMSLSELPITPRGAQPTPASSQTKKLSGVSSPNSRGVVTPVTIKTESGNTQSARSVFRNDHSSPNPVTPKGKTLPTAEGDDDDEPEEDWVINFKKNSLVISGIELDRWEERILRGARVVEQPPRSMATEEEAKPGSATSPSIRGPTGTGSLKR